MLNLYIVRVPEEEEPCYEEYDSFVIAAKNENHAKSIAIAIVVKPWRHTTDYAQVQKSYFLEKWKRATVKVIGISNSDKSKLIHASFNAG